MSIQQAVLLGALIVAGAIIGVSFVPHYQISTGPSDMAYRLNTLTGEVKVCESVHSQVIDLRPNEPKPIPPGSPPRLKIINPVVSCFDQ